MQVLFGNRNIATTQSLKFLGLTIDTSLTWKYHVGELTLRLNKACYAFRSIKPFMSLDVLKSTYFSYVHSIISYGITFWGNSSHSEEIFKTQKRIIRIVLNSSKNASCQYLFKELNILPIQSQCIAHLRQQCHNSKLVIFQEKDLKFLKCYTFLWMQQRQNCSPVASFANCVMILYLLKMHQQTFLSIPTIQKYQILSCDTPAANEIYILNNFICS